MTVPVPTAIYGSGTWVVRRNHEVGIQTAGVKLLRECTRADQQRSTQIRKNN